MTGALVLLGALAGATSFGLWRRARDGRLRDRRRADDQIQAALRAELGVPGGVLSLVQFSSAFCAPCRATRALLTHVVGEYDGRVAHVEVDAESHLDAVRTLGILRTPTTLVVDSGGRVLQRATGLPRADEVRAAIGAALGLPSTP